MGDTPYWPWGPINVFREVTLEALAIIIEIARTASGRHTASHSVTPTTVMP